MISTPYTKGPWATSTPIQAHQDSGYFGSSEKKSLESQTLSPIKEISNFPRTPEFIELPKFKLSQEFDSVLNASGVIRQLDFNTSEIFNKNIKSLPQADSFPSFQYHDLSASSDEGIDVFTQFTSNSPLKNTANLERWFSLFSKPLPSVPKQKCTVDILVELKKKNLSAIIYKILSLLSDADLCRISRVSKMWKNIVFIDLNSRLRKAKFLLKKRSQKENLTRIRGVEESVRRETFLNANGALFNKGNLDKASKPPQKQFSTRFDSFMKEGETCKGSTQLMKCPICKYAAKELYKNLCHCTECKHTFCRVCLSPFQNNHKCFAPTEKPLLVGSKTSKRNLKRL